MILNEMYNQLVLNESTDTEVSWDFEDVTIMQKNQGNQGKGKGGNPPPGSSKVKPVGPPPPGGQPQPGQGDDGDGQKGEQGQPGQPGQGQQGEGGGEKKPRQGSGGQQGPQRQKADDAYGEGGGKPKPGKGKGGKKMPLNLPQSWDDHGDWNKSDGSSPADPMKKASEAMEEKYHSPNPDDWGGAQGEGRGEGDDGIGTYRGILKKALRQTINLSPIKSKLKQFKEEVAKTQDKEQSYGFWLYGATGEGGAGKVMRPVDVRTESKHKQSALLLFSVDTSGSLDEDEFKKVYGWLDELAKFFEGEKTGGIPGRVYLLEWDHRVNGPIYKWKRQQYPKEGLRGGGGTDIQNMFDFCNQHFTESKTTNGIVSNYFKFDEREKVFVKDEGDKLYNIKHKINSHTTRKDKLGDFKLKKVHEQKFKYGDIIWEPGANKFANVPFMVIFTDGMFTPPSNFGHLYNSNLGNIIYICTRKDGIKNCRPRNLVYTDMFVEGFDEEFTTGE